MLIAVAYVPNRKTSTAAHFERAADENARVFWLWFVAAAIVVLGAPLWWVAVPGIHVICAGIAWLSCRDHAERLRDKSELQYRRYNVLRERAANSNEWSHSRIAARKQLEVRSRRAAARKQHGN